jgi:uncharacterized protein (TIGR01777 family)
MRFSNNCIIPFDRKTVIDWFYRSGAFIRLAPSFDRIIPEQLAPGVSEGRIGSFLLGIGPLKFEWKSIHHMDANQNFTDEMLKGPFAKWRHHHQFIAEGSSTRLIDEVEWEGPFSSLFSPIFKGQVNESLRRNFRYRYRRLQHDLARHQKYKDQPRLKIGITGSTGVIGSALSAFLSTGGHEVYHFVRRTPKHEREIYWSPKTQEIEAEAMKELDLVVHLAGENVAGKRWSPGFKKEVLESRTRGTELIAKTLATLKGKPRKLISASAIGIYSGGFLGEVCERWEKALEPALNQQNLKVTIARIGVVLTSKGGALKELTVPALLGVGGKMGSGTQPISWISQDDVIGGIYELMFNPDATEPVYDLVSPTPIEQQELSRTLAKILHRPHFFTIPSVVIKTVLGQMGEEVLLSGQSVEPKGLQALHFDFEFKSLEDLLCFELGREMKGPVP